MTPFAALLAAALLVACQAASMFGDVASYDKYQVVRVVPTSPEHVSALSQLESSGDLDIWTGSRHLNSPWDVMVKPQVIEDFRRVLDQSNLKWSVVIDDLGRTIDAERKSQEPGVSSRMAGGQSRSSPRYLRYSEILEYMNDLAERYPEIASVEVIGKSGEGRDMKILKISSAKESNSTAKRPAIWIDAGIHAREWIAPATAVHFMNQLVENRTHTHELTDDIDWYILPVVNPDGYEFSHTNDRMWRKTRSKTWWGLGCAGADANRNFDFHWREVGASWSSCSDTYAGSKAFSEPEARAIRDFLLNNKDHIKMYLTYHSYGNYLLYPWGFTQKLPDDWKTLDNLAKAANKAMVTAGSKPYTIGSSTNVLYAAAGGSDDWAKAVAGIELSYTIELPGGSSNGFDLPAANIPVVGRHQMEAIKVFADHVKGM